MSYSRDKFDPVLVKRDKKIINFVCANSFLYDSTKPEYRSIELKEQKWLELGKQVGLTAEKVKRKWKTFRDCYYRGRKKELFEGVNPDGIRPWKYMHLMGFLKDPVVVVNPEEYDSIPEDEFVIPYTKDDECKVYDKNIACSTPINDGRYNLEYVDISSNKSFGNPLSDSEYKREDSYSMDGKNMESASMLEQSIHRKLDTFLMLLHSVANKEPEVSTAESAFFKSMALQAEKHKFSSERWSNVQMAIISIMQQEAKKQREENDSQTFGIIND